MNNHPYRLDRSPVAQLLSDARFIKCITIAEAAKRVGLPHFTYRNYEYGRRPLPLAAAYKISKALDIPLEKLAEAAEKSEKSEKLKGAEDEDDD